MLSEKDDLKVEAQVALWLENNYVSINDIVFRPAGAFKRVHKNDVIKTEKRSSGITYIDISREGLYDMLPEGVFHESGRKIKKDTEECVEESRRFREEEKAARKFFLPLEQEFYAQKVGIEHLELKSFLDIINPESLSMFLSFWGINTDLFYPEQSRYLLSIFPNLYRIAGNFKMIEYCIETLFQYKVVIEMGAPTDDIITEHKLLSEIGGMVLGYDVVLGNTFCSGEPSIKVIMGPVPIEEIIQFLPEGKAEKQLMVLYQFLFPADATVETCLLVGKAKDPFSLIMENGYSRLGCTTEL